MEVCVYICMSLSLSLMNYMYFGCPIITADALVIILSAITSHLRLTQVSETVPMTYLSLLFFDLTFLLAVRLL